jgi:hypothetical protein
LYSRLSKLRNLISASKKTADVRKGVAFLFDAWDCGVPDSQ